MPYLSYLMGAADISDEELTSLGVEIVSTADSGSRKLKIPEGALARYSELIKKKLSKGFWNEIIGPKEILFLFHFEDGHIEEYTLSSENEQQVGKLCAEFSGASPEETAKVYRYLSENDFYHSFMAAHYKEMMVR